MERQSSKELKGGSSPFSPLARAQAGRLTSVTLGVAAVLLLLLATSSRPATTAVTLGSGEAAGIRHPLWWFGPLWSGTGYGSGAPSLGRQRRRALPRNRRPSRCTNDPRTSHAVVLLWRGCRGRPPSSAPGRPRAAPRGPSHPPPTQPRRGDRIRAGALQVRARAARRRLGRQPWCGVPARQACLPGAARLLPLMLPPRGRGPARPAVPGASRSPLLAPPRPAAVAGRHARPHASPRTRPPPPPPPPKQTQAA
jgi:hypothetical protein